MPLTERSTSIRFLACWASTCSALKVVEETGSVAVELNRSSMAEPVTVIVFRVVPSVAGWAHDDAATRLAKAAQGRLWRMCTMRVFPDAVTRARAPQAHAQADARRLGGQQLPDQERTGGALGWAE